MAQPKVIDNSRRFMRVNARVLDAALGRMGRDIVQVTKIRIPFKSGDLQKEIEHKKVAKLVHKVIINKEYAAYQEKGQRADGSRVVRKYTTPGTGKNALKDGGTTVTKDALNYLKQAASQVKI